MLGATLAASVEEHTLSCFFASPELIHPGRAPSVDLQDLPVVFLASE